jgi:hypothetical protein
VFPSTGEWLKDEGWVSHCYGERQKAPVFSFSVLANGSEELVTFILPEATGAHTKPVVREIEATGGRAFEINHDGKHDVLLLRAKPDHFADWLEVELLPRVETARISSDFDLSWTRFSSEQARNPDELVLLDGSYFEVEERKILDLRSGQSYVVTRRIDDLYYVESEDGEVTVAT